MNSEPLRQAIALIQSGDLKGGQALLLKLVEQDPTFEDAWMWLAVTVDEITTRRYYLWMALQANPINALAQTAMSDVIYNRQWLADRLAVEYKPREDDNDQPRVDRAADPARLNWRESIGPILIPMLTYPVLLAVLVIAVVVAFASSSRVSAKLPAETVIRVATRLASTATLPAPTLASPTPKPTDIPSDTPVPTPAPTATLGPDGWMSLPVVPQISITALEIYRKGLALGNNPLAFSKVGDCNSLSTRFLTYFDLGPTAYDLGNYGYLGFVVEAFKGSFTRQSLAVGDGFNTSAVLSQFRADPNYCNGGESPLTCEYRLNKPSFAFIAIGTDDYLAADKFEANLRQIVQITIDHGIVPILATKADNANQLNYNPIIAKVANEFDIPLWNLWAAMNPLQYGGLEDNIHPTGSFAAFVFSADNLSRFGWTERNLTAMQALYSTWVSVSQPADAQ